MRLKGKVAIVTGAGSGIGRATALTLAREGADVVIADIDLESAREAAGEVKALGRQAMAVKVDVSKCSVVNQLVVEAVAVSAEHKIGRNDPCPCGSGKKYKKCHGK